MKCGFYHLFHFLICFKLQNKTAILVNSKHGNFHLQCIDHRNSVTNRLYAFTIWVKWVPKRVCYSFWEVWKLCLKLCRTLMDHKKESILTIYKILKNIMKVKVLIKKYSFFCSFVSLSHTLTSTASWYYSTT